MPKPPFHPPPPHPLLLLRPSRRRAQPHPRLGLARLGRQGDRALVRRAMGGEEVALWCVELWGARRSPRSVWHRGAVAEHPSHPLPSSSLPHSHQVPRGRRGLEVRVSRVGLRVETAPRCWALPLRAVASVGPELRPLL